MDDLEKTIGHFIYTTSSFVHHFKSIGEVKLKLQSGNAQFGSKLVIVCPAWPWNLTIDLEKQYGTSSKNIKFCASFHHHMWIQTGVTARKRLRGVMTSVTLTFDLWPWLFAWTSPLSLMITYENFMMIRWCEKKRSDRRTDRRTDGQTGGLNHS